MRNGRSEYYLVKFDGNGAFKLSESQWREQLSSLADRYADHIEVKNMRRIRTRDPELKALLKEMDAA